MNDRLRSLFRRHNFDLRSGAPDRRSGAWLLVLLMLAIAAAALWAVFSWLQPPTAPKARPRPGIVICLDPGHPTDFNSGKRLLNGVTEMEMNWQVTLKLASLLEEKDNITVVKTREIADQVMNNRERAEVANKAGATLLVRLHCDAGPGRGFTVYYPDRQGSDKDATGPAKSVIHSSRRAAYALHSGMAGVLRDSLRDRGVKGESRTRVGSTQGALTGSIFSRVPVVTVEMVFLTDVSDALFISTEEGQERMARALANGILNYLRLSHKSPGGSRVPERSHSRAAGP